MAALDKDIILSFVHTVKQLRRSQRESFLSGGKRSLAEAKRLERKVDNYLESFFSAQEDFNFKG